MFTKVCKWGLEKEKGGGACNSIVWLHFHGCKTVTTTSVAMSAELSNFMLYYYLILESALNHNYFILSERPFDQVPLESHPFHLSQVVPEIRENIFTDYYNDT